MNQKILFMIIDDQVKFLNDNKMDHREWYNSLGLDPNNYENIVRGFVIDGKIIFFKGMNFIYDQEVINMAKRHAPGIRLYLTNSQLEVYCGIEANSLGGKWEPILKINENELIGVIQEKKEKAYIEKDAGPIIEFKNNYDDPKFIKRAILITGIVLILSLIINIIGIITGNNKLDFLEMIFIVGQVALLIITIIGYNKKRETVKLTGIAASLLLVFTFNIFNIILAVFYFVFSVDQNYFIKIINKLKKKKEGKYVQSLL